MKREPAAPVASVPIALSRQDEGRLLTLTIEHRVAAEAWVPVGNDTLLGFACDGGLVALTVTGTTGEDAVLALLRAFEQQGGALASSFERLLRRP